MGGTLKGLTSKIGYLQRLAVTAIWVSPIFKQVTFHETYHGYGIHNFLEVDPHFGTRADLVQMVETVHRAGIYVFGAGRGSEVELPHLPLQPCSPSHA